MTFDLRASRFCALHFRGLIIAAGFTITVAATAMMCRNLSAEKVQPGERQRKAGEIVISTWAGEIRVEGAAEVVQPLVDSVKTSNRIEAEQNHKAWGDLPADPEEYR